MTRSPITTIFTSSAQTNQTPVDMPIAMTTDPWTVKVEGWLKSQGNCTEDLLSGFDLQERIYRFRCVEAWSMVVPWIGFPLSELLARVEPRAEGRYVEFKTLYRPSEMRHPVLHQHH